MGNAFSKDLRLGLHLPTLQLHITDRNLQPLNRIALDGKGRSEVFQELRVALEERGVDVSALIDEEPFYSIPHHPIADGAPFNVHNLSAFKEVARSRHNAGIILEEVAAEHKDASDVRIWPHHFDTGAVIPIERKSDGSVTRSLGIGWAIPDGMVPEPYYYLSLWSESGPEDFSTLEAIAVGEWITSGWQGAVLPHSSIVQQNDPAQQLETVREFFKSGIAILIKSILHR